MSGDIAALVERLELLAAWRKPGGPTPKQKMPDTYTAVVEAKTTITDLQARLEAAEAQNAKLREALAFYAREQSWRSSGVYMSGRSQATAAELDGGAKARATLGGEHG